MYYLLGNIVPNKDIIHDGDTIRDRPWRQMSKVLFLKERVSPVSLLGFGDGSTWDWDEARANRGLMEREARTAQRGLVRRLQA